MTEEERLMWTRTLREQIETMAQLLIPLRAAGTLRSLMKAGELERRIRHLEASLRWVEDQIAAAENQS